MKNNQEEPITPGCPSLMPHNLPGGFDGVEPGEDNDNDKCICAIVETKGEINKFRKWDTRVLYATLAINIIATVYCVICLDIMGIGGYLVASFWTFRYISLNKNNYELHDLVAELFALAASSIAIAKKISKE